MDATVLLPPDPVSATTARRFTERQLAAWGLSGLVDTARLLVSELVINAVTHARTESMLVLTSDGRGLRVEVTDRCAEVPRIQEQSPEVPTGRGLRIVAQLAAEWGVVQGPDGKTVWFELLPVP
jgi:anti-sigma regulatory factor (Ser/Thr protein kinase)